ncbi:TPA: hypothetical protein MW242_003101 [Acinetobacter baumannii]|nr:hypothetical protein [Acinetobacter baumannii]
MLLNIIHILLLVLTCFYWLILIFTKFPDFSLMPIIVLSVITIWVTAYFTWKYLFKGEKKKAKIFITVMLSSFSPVFMYLLTNIFVMTNMEVQKRKYIAEITYEQNNEKGFLKIKKFANEQYGIPLRLGGYEESWALTSLVIPQASVASLRTETGYCTINMSKTNIHNMYGQAKYPGPYQDWQRLIFAHELAHCIDRTRDLSPSMGTKILNTKSIPPVLRSNAKDLETYLSTEENKSTILWREAFADIYAIGFMYVKEPEKAKNLEKSLIYYRQLKSESTHGTSCWLNYASKLARPKSSNELVTWADKIRSNAPCI